MSPLNHNAARAMRPAIVAVACVLATAIAVNAIVTMALASPHIGDIVTFSPSAEPQSEESARLVVHRQNRSDCVLDMRVLHRTGGSMVIETEAVGQPGGFGVHWAGARTSEDSTNCGGDADLTVAHRDLDMLALSAGGYGIGQKRLPILTGDISN
jgi:hypothetical protein